MAPHFILGSKQDDKEELIEIENSSSSFKFVELWKPIFMRRKLIYFFVGGVILFFLIFNTIAHLELHSSASSSSSSSSKQTFQIRVISHPCPLEIGDGKIQGNDSMSQGILARVISKPEALIYLNFGTTPEFHFNNLKTRNPVCESLPSSISGNPGLSLETMGTCIRLYDEDGCHGNSTAVYPKMQEEKEIEHWPSSELPFLKAAKSMSPCFQNELDGASFHYSPASGPGSGLIHFQKKKRSNGDFLIPDELKVKERLVAPNPESIVSKLGKLNHVFGDPIKYYFSGHSNRLEFIEAIFQQLPRHEKENETTTAVFPPRQLSEFQEAGDELGVFIPLKFRPQVKLQFYQSESNRKEMEQVEDRISDYLRENPKEKVEARIDIHYDPETSTRPVNFFYWLKFGKEVQIFRLSNYPEASVKM